jgi:hypothetical protein
MRQAVTHQWLNLRQFWWLAPCSTPFVLFFSSAWPSLWGAPLLVLAGLNAIVGSYVSFRSVHFLPHLIFGGLTFGLTVILSLGAGPVAMTAALVFGLPQQTVAWVAIWAIMALLAVMGLGTGRYLRLDWAEGGRWMTENARPDVFRIFHRSMGHGSRSRVRVAVPYLVVLGLALINLAGFLWFRDAQTLRLLLMPALAVAMFAVFMCLSFLFGRTTAALLRLRAIERDTGHRFILGNIEELHRERREHWLGRWIAPRELHLDSVHGKCE